MPAIVLAATAVAPIIHFAASLNFLFSSFGCSGAGFVSPLKLNDLYLFTPKAFIFSTAIHIPSFLFLCIYKK